MKKTITLLLVLLMTCTLVACSKKEDTSKDNKDEQSEVLVDTKDDTTTEKEDTKTDQKENTTKKDKAAPLELNIPENLVLWNAFEGELHKIGDEIMWTDGGFTYKFYQLVGDNQYEIYDKEPGSDEWVKDESGTTVTIEEIYKDFQVTVSRDDRTDETDEIEGIVCQRYFDEDAQVYEYVWEEYGILMKHGNIGEFASMWVNYVNQSPIQFPTTTPFE